MNMHSKKKKKEKNQYEMPTNEFIHSIDEFLC